MYRISSFIYLFFFFSQRQFNEAILQTFTLVKTPEKNVLGLTVSLLLVKCLLLLGRPRPVHLNVWLFGILFFVESEADSGIFFSERFFSFSSQIGSEKSGESLLSLTQLSQVTIKSRRIFIN